MTEKLREKIANVFRCERECSIYPSLCRKSRCALKAEQRDYEFAGAVMPHIKETFPELAKEAGYVELANDQSLPSDMDSLAYASIMLKAGWRKVELEETK